MTKVESMTTLFELSRTSPYWDIDTFVEVTNRFLPQYLAGKPVNERSENDVNPRLVRFYTTKGVLAKPEKEGREARYLYRHLLQLLLIRRLLSQGYSLPSIQPIMQGRSDEELEGLLQGGVQVKAETRNPAIAFLSQVKARQESKVSFPKTAAQDLQVFQTPRPAQSEELSQSEGLIDRVTVSQWRRVEILPGLELNIREDFTPPVTRQELTNLCQLISQKLQVIFQFRQVLK
ncbi:MerR family transcriptional regulator [Picosynechococcus sp. NKBG15041c]|uniref:MerR family transcriptional regulator n=1 Tax=Picosynechococcus sp. NKBG15041c TaxID=1407650 RepID=UPI001F00EC20|nr:MerR family transcriptional regulator [Picosynechococcus sp. NKBG15041c]